MTRLFRLGSLARVNLSTDLDLGNFQTAARELAPVTRMGDESAATRQAALGIRSMASEAKLLTVQFLSWVASRPRTYADVQDAWKSTCPLNCAWEDAIFGELVQFGPDGYLTLTARGHAALGN